MDTSLLIRRRLKELAWSRKISQPRLELFFAAADVRKGGRVVRTSEILSAWAKILKGAQPSLSIEITRSVIQMILVTHVIDGLVASRRERRIALQ